MALWAAASNSGAEAFWIVSLMDSLIKSVTSLTSASYSLVAFSSQEWQASLSGRAEAPKTQHELPLGGNDGGERTDNNAERLTLLGKSDGGGRRTWSEFF